MQSLRKKITKLNEPKYFLLVTKVTVTVRFRELATLIVISMEHPHKDTKLNPRVFSDPDR